MAFAQYGQPGPLRVHVSTDRVSGACSTLVDALEVAVLVVNREGVLVAVTGSFARYGWADDEIVGRAAESLCEPVDRDRWRSWAASEDASPLDFRLVDKSGALHPVRARRAPVDGDEEEPAGQLIALLDLRTSPLLASQLLAAQRMEAIGLLTGGLAHDFNCLLALVVSHTALSRAAVAPDSQVASDLDQVLEASHRAGMLVRQLLSLGGHQERQLGATDVGAVVGDLARMLRRILGDQVHLEIDAPLGLRVRATETQLVQIVMNLVTNARDSMPAGGTVSLSALRSADGQEVVLEVVDTGLGITPSTADRIFEPFFTTKGGAGTGIGLSVTKSIVQRLDGTISFDSGPGVGSRFWVRLPAMVEAEEPAPHPVGRAGRGTRVLVVEDDVALRLLIDRVLTGDGFTVTLASSASSALEQARTAGGQLDVLLLDRVLPDSAGPQLGLALRKLCPNAAVVYMSGFTDGLEGMVGADILLKPFERAGLLAAVSRAAQGTGPHRRT